MVQDIKHYTVHRNIVALVMDHFLTVQACFNALTAILYVK